MPAPFFANSVFKETQKVTPNITKKQSISSFSKNEISAISNPKKFASDGRRSFKMSSYQNKPYFNSLSLSMIDADENNSPPENSDEQLIVDTEREGVDKYPQIQREKIEIIHRQKTPPENDPNDLVLMRRKQSQMDEGYIDIYDESVDEVPAALSHQAKATDLAKYTENYKHERNNLQKNSNRPRRYIFSDEQDE